MIEQVYYSVLKNLGVELDKSSDNLFMVPEGDVVMYIGKDNYLELKKVFDKRLEDKYIKCVDSMVLLDPVRVVGVAEDCFYLDRSDLFGVVDVHYIFSLSKLYSVTKAHEGLIEGRVPSVGERDKLYGSLLKNKELEGSFGEGDFVFDIRDYGREELLRVVSVQSVYKNYNYYLAVLETSEGLVKTLPLQSLVRLKE